MAEKKKVSPKTKKQEVKNEAPAKQDAKKQTVAPGATTKQDSRIGVFICHCGDQHCRFN